MPAAASDPALLGAKSSQTLRAQASARAKMTTSTAIDATAPMRTEGSATLSRYCLILFRAIPADIAA